MRVSVGVEKAVEKADDKVSRITEPSQKVRNDLSSSIILRDRNILYTCLVCGERSARSKLALVHYTYTLSFDFLSREQTKKKKKKIFYFFFFFFYRKRQRGREREKKKEKQQKEREEQKEERRP